MSTASKTLFAGALRQRVSIDRQDHVQDGTTGAITTSWTQIASSVPANIEPVSGREFVAAAQVGSILTARITIRFRPSLNAAMRVRHGDTIYRIKAILPDPNSGKEWLTLLVEVME